MKLSNILNIRNLHLSGIICCLCLLLASCSEDYYDRFEGLLQDVTLSVSPMPYIAFGSEGGTISVIIETDVDWEIIDMPDWLTSSETKGFGSTEVEFTASNHTGIDMRSDTFAIIAKVGKVTFRELIYVDQGGIAPYLYVTAPSDYSCVGDTYDIKIASNEEWKAEFSEYWGSLKIVDDTINLTLIDNPYSESRSGVLSVKSNSGEKKEVTITQDGCNFVVDTHDSSDKLSFEATASTKEITITSDLPWSVEISEGLWLSVSQKSGNAGSTTIKVTATANTGYDVRSDRLFFTIGGELRKEIEVSQASKDHHFTLSATELSFEAGAASQKFTIDTSYSWSITAPSWVTITKNSDTRSTPEVVQGGKTEVTVTAAANDTYQERSGTITITNPLTKEVLGKVNITQKAAKEHYFNISPTQLSFSNEGDTKSISLDTSHNWSISAPGWITLSKSQGSAGNYDISATIATNTSTISRYGKITISSTDTQETLATIIVIQEGNFSISNDHINVPYNSSTVSVQIISDVRFTVHENIYWITIDKTIFSEGTQTLQINISTNNTQSARSGSIWLKDEADKNLGTIHVTQLGQQ